MLGLLLDPGQVSVNSKSKLSLPTDKLTLLDGLLDVGRFVSQPVPK